MKTQTGALGVIIVVVIWISGPAGVACTPWCPQCAYWDGYDCYCPVTITNVTASADTVCAGCSVTFTATTNNESCLFWSAYGGDPPTQQGGKTFTTHWHDAGTHMAAAGACDGDVSKGKTVTVVGVNSVTHSRPRCWDGEQIIFTAVPNPSDGSFPGGQPVWTASAGSFPSGSTGTSVTWRAPSGSGGYATITATCGSSSANDAVSYGYVYIGGNGGDLLRSESDEFSATVQPSDFPVSFAQDSSTSPVLSVNPLWGAALEVDNLILASDLQAWTDDALAAISVLVPDLSPKLFGRTYHLKKQYRDWADNVVLPDAEDIFDAAQDFGMSLAGNAAYDTFTGYGFNSFAADSARQNVRTAVSSCFSTIYPFPPTMTDSIINESRTYSVTYNVAIETANLTFTLLPNFKPPGDVMAWIGSINQHGFLGVLTELETGPTIKLSLTAAGSTWSVPFSASLDFSDDWGKCTLVITMSAGIYIE